MKKIAPITLFIAVVILIQLTSCTTRLVKKNKAVLAKTNSAQNKKDFIATLEKHLSAVSKKDITALESTMSPDGKMHLILPQTEIISSVDSFIDFHKKWFEDPNWTFETKILHTDIGNTIGLAITEIMYKEPDRNGKPYFNKMIVTYGLEKIDGSWYVIKDHASSVEKSTDKN